MSETKGVLAEHEQDGCHKEQHRHQKQDTKDTRPMSLVGILLVFTTGLIIGAVFL